MSDEINIKTKSKKTKLFIAIAAVVIVLLTAFAVIFATSKGATAKKVEKQLSLGAKYLSELNYEQAIVAYELVIEIDPKNAEAYIGLADVYIAMGDYEKAEEVLEEAKGKVTKEDALKKIEKQQERVTEKREEAEKPTAEQTTTLESNSMPDTTLAPMPTEVQEEATDVSWFEYEETEDGNIRITGLKDGAPEKIVIPERIEGKLVTEIGDFAFLSCDIKQVIIPNTVLKIGEEAFAACLELCEIVVPNSVITISGWAFFNCFNLRTIILSDGIREIGAGAFSNCDLRELFLPASIEKIGSGAFGSNTDLKSIEVAETNKNYMVKEGVLFSADGTELVQVPAGLEKNSYRIPAGTVRVTGEAFSGCTNLSTVIIAESVKEIGDEAFRWCKKLTEIKIPENVEKIGDAPFVYCDLLEKIEVDEKNQYYSSYNGALYNKNKTELLQVPYKFDTEVYKLYEGVKVIGSYACDSTSYVGFELPEGLETIERGTFRNNDELTEIRLPDGVRRLEYWAFEFCDCLSKVEIPESVTFIANYVFQNSPNVIIYTREGSYADTYAQENNIPVSYK